MSTILIISKNYPPAICGVGDHSFQLRQAWEQVGHRVFVLTTTVSDLPGVFHVPEFTRALPETITAIARQKQVEGLFWQYVPYSFRQNGLPFWWPGVIRRLRAVVPKQLIYFHEVSLRTTGDGLKQGLVARLQRSIARNALRYVQTGFTNIRLYQSYFPGRKPLLVPVSSNFPPPRMGKQSVPGRIVCFANRADAALFRAVSQVSGQRPVQLVLCGKITSAKQAWLEAQVQSQGLSERVEFTGTMQPQEIADVIATAAVFIQPELVKNGRGGISAKNGTLMAAMQAGVPIVACGGDMTDNLLFRDGENLLLVPYGDAAAYAAAILRILQDAVLAQRLRTAAARTYQEHCRWEITAGLMAAEF